MRQLVWSQNKKSVTPRPGDISAKLPGLNFAYRSLLPCLKTADFVNQAKNNELMY